MRDTTVSQLVEKYRLKYPDLDRDLLRKLIRLENNLTKDSTKLRQLDRCLEESFKPKKSEVSESNHETEPSALIQNDLRAELLSVAREVTAELVYGDPEKSYELLVYAGQMFPEPSRGKFNMFVKAAETFLAGELKRFPPFSPIGRARQRHALLKNNVVRILLAEFSSLLNES
ncbi:MAG: hypothetical protein WCD81_08615 [Candidatus Bathyarchaeia archaeon]